MMDQLAAADMIAAVTAIPIFLLLATIVVALNRTFYCCSFFELLAEQLLEKRAFAHFMLVFFTHERFLFPLMVLVFILVSINSARCAWVAMNLVSIRMSILNFHLKCIFVSFCHSRTGRKCPHALIRPPVRMASSHCNCSIR